MGKGGGGGSESTTTTMEPPEFLVPFLEQAAQGLRTNVADTPRFIFEGNRTADRSQASALGFDDLMHGRDRGLQRLGNIKSTASQLMNGNDFNRAFETARERINPAIASQFAAAGRFGSGAHASALGEGLGRAFTDARGAFRDRQLQSANLLRSIVGAEQELAKPLLAIGAQRDAENQRNLDREIAVMEAIQNEPRTRAQEFSAGLTGIAPSFGNTSTGTSAQQQSSNPLGTILGGALTLGSLFF